MAWKPEYGLLLLFSTVVDYYAGLKIGQTQHQFHRRCYLWLSLAVNLGVLFGFKYLNFFNETTRQLLDQFNIFYNVPAFDLLLPVGISFYTFQTLSYTIDVYQGRIEPEKHFGYFALYVSFWPQLVAGPIERASHLLPQLKQLHYFNEAEVKAGLIRILWGFIKKLVIADRLALYVDEVYNNPGVYDGTTILLATYFFTFQVYCDFSGYSDIAIGTAKVMGFQLSENFRRPFFARSPAEFWRRWHITMTNWFRDYLMFPLMRHPRLHLPWYAALIITFILVGLWHGANWTFIAWGGLQGLFIMVGRWYQFYYHRYMPKLLPFTLPDKTIALLQIVLTFNLITLSVIFFRADTIQQAVNYLQAIFFDWGWQIPPMPRGWPDFVLSLILIMALLVSEYLLQDRPIEEVIRPKVMPVRWAFYIAGLLLLTWFGVFTQNQFIYFEF